VKPLFLDQVKAVGGTVIWEQEQRLIESFKEKRVKGIATAKEILLAYEQKIGHQVHKTNLPTTTA